MPRPILHVIGPSIAYVVLTHGEFSVIEVEDAELIGQRNWAFRSVQIGTHTKVTVIGNFNNKSVKLHRYLMGLDGPGVDHKNGNRLDNRRYGNLRHATHEQQMWNRKGMRSDLPKGVGPSTGGAWRARIRIDGKKVHLGTTRTIEEAAELYRQAELRLRGEFAIGHRSQV